MRTDAENRDAILLAQLRSAITQCTHLLGETRTNEWLRELDRFASRNKYP
jgi:hypothetical protein